MSRITNRLIRKQVLFVGIDHHDLFNSGDQVLDPESGLIQLFDDTENIAHTTTTKATLSALVWYHSSSSR